MQMLQGNQTRAWAVILISEKVDFKSQNVTRDKDGPYIIIKGQFTRKTYHIQTHIHPKPEYQYIKQRMVFIFLRYATT